MDADKDKEDTEGKANDSPDNALCLHYPRRTIYARMIAPVAVYLASWQVAAAQALPAPDFASDAMKLRERTINALPRTKPPVPPSPPSDIAKKDRSKRIGRLAPGQAETIIAERSLAAMRSLQRNDMSAFSKFVHPAKGVRFSPYVSADKQDRTFSAKRVASLSDDPTFFLWGSADGSGDPIKLPWSNYRKRFVYDRDFINAREVSFNAVKIRGNILNNLDKVFSGAIFVEYYLPESQLDRGDWGGLWLIWDKQGRHWYLVGIAHDEWGT